MSIVTDDAWDTNTLDWVGKYDDSGTDDAQPDEVFSDAYGFYDKHFRLKFDGTIYRAYDFILFVSGPYRVSSDGVYFQRWMPQKPVVEYSAANAPPKFLPPVFK